MGTGLRAWWQRGPTATVTLETPGDCTAPCWPAHPRPALAPQVPSHTLHQGRYEVSSTQDPSHQLCAPTNTQKQGHPRVRPAGPTQGGSTKPKGFNSGIKEKNRKARPMALEAQDQHSANVNLKVKWSTLRLAGRTTQTDHLTKHTARRGTGTRALRQRGLTEVCVGAGKELLELVEPRGLSFT